MKAKAILTAACLVVFASLALIPNPSWAGSPQRHRWEGVAIGVGAAIIGSALINSLHQSSAYAEPAPAAAYHPVYERRHAPRGHWAIEKEWVEPVTRKEWNPGHYTPPGALGARRMDLYRGSTGVLDRKKGVGAASVGHLSKIVKPPLHPPSVHRGWRGFTMCASMRICFES